MLEKMSKSVFSFNRLSRISAIEKMSKSVFIFNRLSSTGTYLRDREDEYVRVKRNGDEAQTGMCPCSTPTFVNSRERQQPSHPQRFQNNGPVSGS